MPSLTNAQVIIKEKVEINPLTINPDSPNSGNEPTYTYIYSWTPSEYVRGNIKITTCTGDTINSGWTTSGYSTISHSGMGSHYFLFQRQRYFYRSSTGYGWYDDEISSAQKQVLVDGVSINTVVGGTTVGTIAIPNFNLEGTLCDTNRVSLTIQPIEYASCSEIGWFPTDALSLRIIEGANYASFYNLQTGANLGSNIVVDPFVSLDDLMIFWGLYWERDGLENIVLKQNETVLPDNIPHPIIIEATINGIVFTSETQWYPNNYNLTLDSYPDSIASGEYAGIGVTITNECRFFPMETKLNAEIVKGQEYGSLIDPYTNERTKILSNLDHWFGNAWIDLIADGKTSLQNDTVVIRISTTDPEITPKEINVYIKPPSIFVYTNPEVVGATDTAEVVIKKKNSDGTLEDFPQGQAFELAVLDGCINGNILVGDSLGVYFSDAQLPIYFVAADIVAGDSGIVRLRVGADLDGSAMKPLMQGSEKNEKLTDEQIRIAELKVGYNKMIVEKKEEMVDPKSDADGEQPIEAPILEVCYYGSYLYETGYWEGDVVVDNGCDYPPYDSNLYALNYELIRHDNYYPWVFDDDAQFPITTLIDVCDSPDSNQSGGSKPVFYSRIRKNQFGSYVNSWDIQPLIDREDKLHFTIIDPITKVNTSLKFDFVTGVCYNKINPPSQEPKVLIYNLADISDTKIIPNKDQALQAMEDFCGFHCYPQETFRYQLIDIINLHEGEHMNDYRDSCLIPKFQNLADKIKNITLVCNSYNEDGKKNQIALIKYLIKEFIRDAISHFDQVNILATKNDYTYEKKLHRRPSIVNRITDYTDRLKSEFNISVPANCKTCP